MKLFLILLLIAAMIATVVALVRGIITFLRVTEADLQEGSGPSTSALKSNRMMQQRILCQGSAIAIVAWLLIMARNS